MTTTMLIVLLMIVAVAGYLITRDSGPRVTTIEHRRETEDKKDGDDA